MKNIVTRVVITVDFELSPLQECHRYVAEGIDALYEAAIGYGHIQDLEIEYFEGTIDLSGKVREERIKRTKEEEKE